MSVTERKEREKEQRRKDIVDAAEKLFFSRKFEDVSMEDIANAVELSRATLYLYFEDKESLYFAVILRGFRILDEMFTASANKETTGLGKIEAIGNSFIEFYKTHGDYHGLFHYAQSERFRDCDNEYKKEAETTSEDLVNIMCESIRKGIEDGTLKKDLDPLNTAIFLMHCTEEILNSNDLAKSGKKGRNGVNHEEYVRHSMKLIGYAILDETYNKGVNYDRPSH